MAKKKVAVFDVDGTIFRSSFLIQIVEELIDEGHFPVEAQFEYERERQRWLDREGDYESYIAAMVKTFRKHIKGVHYGAFANASDAVVNSKWRQTYRYTRDLLEDLKSKGYYLLAISHSPKTILDRFCPKLGFDKTYGIIYEVGPNDCFTGKTTDEHLIMNKAAILHRAVEKENLSLAHSIGVGDTESDISFLEIVAKPICFNPNAKLNKYAKRMGWKVVVERKDVVYEL